MKGFSYLVSENDKSKVTGRVMVEEKVSRAKDSVLLFGFFLSLCKGRI